MKYNYTPLWETLQQKGLSRKQLREILQLSPATMARMSAEEPIATETLGRICDLLQCTLDKIFTIIPENDTLDRWSCLNEKRVDGNPLTFRIFLYLYLASEDNNTAEYIYGYAMPFIFDETDMKTWYLTQGIGDYKQFFVIDGTLYANELRQLIDAAANCHTLDGIFKLLKVELEVNGKKIRDKNLTALNNTLIANGSFVYRPPYLLPPRNSTLEYMPELMPLLSYKDETTICESLHGANKKQYYYSENRINVAKAKLIWNYLSENLPFQHNLNEIARLGNFEILTLPKETTQQPVRCEIWRDNRNQKGAKITVSTQLAGNYILRVKLQNGRNPIFDSSYILNPQDPEENPVYIALDEDFYFAEYELWSEYSTGSPNQRLIYHSCTPYVRQLSLNMSVLEQHLKLEDRWSQAMRKQGQAVNTNVTLYSTEANNPLFGQPEELWLIEEKTIQHDFHVLFGNGKRLHEHDAFFPKGVDNVMAFLSWLKERLKSTPNTQRVIIFDPYINDTAIIKFIRSLNNIRIHYEIITDSYSPMNKGRRENEINKIKNLSTVLENLLTACNLTVRTFIKKTGTLHDRLLMLVDSEQVIVYVLSNSLDSMAKKHSSIVTAVKPSVAQDIFTHYVKLVKASDCENKIETIFTTNNPVLYIDAPISPATTPTNPFFENNPTLNKTTPETQNSEEFHYSKENFIRDYNGNAIQTALKNLAYMNYEEKLACINYIIAQNKTIEIKRLQDILSEAKNSPVPVLNKELVRCILALNQMAIQPFDLTGNLIQAATDAISWCFRFRSALAYPFNYAIKILWLMSPEKYVTYLETLITVYTKANKNKASNTTLTPSALLIYNMLAHIIKQIATKTETENRLQYLAESSNSFMKAFYAAKCAWLSEDFLHKLIFDQESDSDFFQSYIQNKCNTISTSFDSIGACTTLIFLIKNLQIEIYRHRNIQSRIQPLINNVINTYTQIFKNNKKNDASSLIQQLTPLSMRNVADICQIIDTLRSTKQFNAEQSYEVLIHFWKLVYTEKNGKEKLFYNKESIQRSLLLTKHVMQIGNFATAKLQKEIMIRSRELCGQLYDPLLYQKNYSKWKKAVDQLACLFITERYIVSKNNNFSMGKGEKEYSKLTANYQEILLEYSETYRIWKNSTKNTASD